jgi:hypothetical protein
MGRSCLDLGIHAFLSILMGGIKCASFQIECQFYHRRILRERCCPTPTLTIFLSQKMTLPTPTPTPILTPPIPTIPILPPPLITPRPPILTTLLDGFDLQLHPLLSHLPPHLDIYFNQR